MQSHHICFAECLRSAAAHKRARASESHQDGLSAPRPSRHGDFTIYGFDGLTPGARRIDAGFSPWTRLIDGGFTPGTRRTDSGFTPRNEAALSMYSATLSLCAAASLASAERVARHSP